MILDRIPSDRVSYDVRIHTILFVFYFVWEDLSPHFCDNRSINKRPQKGKL